MLPTARPLTPLTQSGRTIFRSAAFVDSEPVVLFQKHDSPLFDDEKPDWVQLLSALNCGPVFELEPGQWEWSRVAAQNFNCHAMAIGSHVGVGPCDWLEGIASEATLDRNPTSIILDHFFDLIAVQPSDSSKPVAELHQNDVFALCDSAHDHFVHSGIVKFVDGTFIAVSKFGEGPILLTSFELIRTFYSGDGFETRWYRHND